jgi:hypothetical protein
MIVGCYSLDLYCNVAKYDGDIFGSGCDGIHEFREFPKTYTSERREDCERAAREDGWMINNNTGICLCPKCSGKKRC